MKVICAGFWKTGTKSLAEALEHLGYKVYDYDYQYFELHELWSKFYAGTVTDDDIREALKDIDVIIDGPVIAYWEEISRAIPDAKIILTIRDEDGWWESYRRAVVRMPFFLRIASLLSYFGPIGKRLTRASHRTNSLVLGIEGPLKLPPFVNFDDNPRMYKNAFRRHNGYVLHNAPREKLLVHQLGDGWKSICEFLGHEIPDVPYPHRNKLGAHFVEEGGPKHPMYKRAVTEAMIMLAVLVGSLSFAVCYALSHVLS